MQSPRERPKNGRADPPRDDVLVSIYVPRRRRFIELVATDKELMHSRSADGRGPVFWVIRASADASHTNRERQLHAWQAYEFGEQDILALLLSDNVDINIEDENDKKPQEFYTKGSGDLPFAAATAAATLTPPLAHVRHRIADFCVVCS